MTRLTTQKFNSRPSTATARLLVHTVFRDLENFFLNNVKMFNGTFQEKI